MMLMDGIVNRRRIPIFFPDLRVVFEEEGILNGWASWPFNFDPHWLVDCTGFEGVR